MRKTNGIPTNIYGGIALWLVFSAAVLSPLSVYAQGMDATQSAVISTTPTPTPTPDVTPAPVSPSPSPEPETEMLPTPTPDLVNQGVATSTGEASGSSLQTPDSLTDFMVDEGTKVLLDTPSTEQDSARIRIRPKLRGLAKKLFKPTEKVTATLDNASLDRVKVRVYRSSGEEVHMPMAVLSQTNPVMIRLAPPRSFTPGRYRLSVADLSGSEIDHVDFSWGVLAINTDRSVYKPHAEAHAAIAVLNETGNMVCDAAVTLDISSPDGAYHTVRSTTDGSIKVNPECEKKIYTTVPDYETSFTVGNTGTYTMKLTAVTGNGENTIEDTFAVQTDQPFDVRRESATRIYPPENYPVKITVHAQTDFTGEIRETVPVMFNVMELDGTKQFDTVTETAESSDSADLVGMLVNNPLPAPFVGEHPIALDFGETPDDPAILEKYQEYGVVGHDGTDFDMPVGTPILAVDGGKVVRARENYDYGTTIVIEHDWGKTYYGHLSTLDIEEGDTVLPKQVIGESGNTGLTTAPHLHFGIKLAHNDPNNGYFGKVDPLPYIGYKPFDGMNTEPFLQDTVKVLTWNVTLKKGDEITLGYTYKAPNVSPMFYTVGPLEFVSQSGEAVFKETRRWQIAADAVTNGGTIVYGDTANGNPDDMDFRTYTETTTVGNELTTVDPNINSNVIWTKIVAAPTREEKLAVSVKATGRMDILKCTTGCDATADWSIIGTYGTVSTAANVVNMRGFDIAYEQLTGRAIVVFTDDNDTGDVYYCIWDGTSWSPTTTNACGTGTVPATFTTVAANNIDLEATLATNVQPEWVRLVSRGSRLTATRSNEMLLGVSDAGDDMFLAHWTGSAWNHFLNPIDNLAANNLQKFDIAWEETTGYGLAVFTDTVDAALRFSIYDPASGWGAADTTTGPTNPATAAWNGWQNLASDPSSDDIAYIASFTGTVDADNAVWDGSSWINGTTGLTDQETPTGKNVDVAFTRFSGRAVFLNVGANDTNFNGHCWTSGGAFTALNAAVGNPNIVAADDIDDVSVAASPNNNRMLMTFRGVEASAGTGDDVRAMTYSDATGCADGDFAPMSTVPLLANSNEGGLLSNTARMAHGAVYTPYSPWSLNWRFFDDETADDPQYGLNGVAENEPPKNVDPEEFLRLRMNMAERGGQGQIDTRKKLQYTSGCNPNISETACTWSDVGDTTETTLAWRYATAGENCTACADGGTSATARLTGTDETAPVYYLADKDNAVDADFDHTALKIKEIDIPLKAEAVDYATTYFFRLYEPRLANNGQDSPVFREQDDDGNIDCATSACTYPSLVTAPDPATLMRHGNWFNGGVEQPFAF